MKARVRVDFACLLDAREWVSRYVTPTDKTVYFLASQCHPKTLDAFDKSGISKFIYHHHSECADDIMAGRTCVLPAIQTTVGMESFVLGYWLGFRKFQGYAMDSCYRGAVLHAHPKEHEKLNRCTIECPETGKSYDCNSDMARQAGEFKQLVEQWDTMVRQGLAEPLDIAIYGEGLIPDLAAFYSQTMKWVRHVR